MTHAKRSPALAASRRGGEYIPRDVQIITHPRAPAVGSLLWRKARGLQTWRDIAVRPMLAYPERVAANSAAGFDSPKLGAPRAIQRARFLCPINGGVRGEPQGSPVLARSVNPRIPPPFRLTAKAWRFHQARRTDMTYPKTAQNPGTLTARQLFDLAFHPHREPRSDAYREGCLAALQCRLCETENPPHCPYPAGTPERDAWFAGCAEGHKRAARAGGEA